MESSEVPESRSKRLSLVAMRDLGLAAAVAEGLVASGCRVHQMSGSEMRRLAPGALLGADRSATDEAVDRLEEDLGDTEILVTDGPLPVRGRFLDTDPTAADALVAGGLIPTVNVLSAIGARMTARGGGRIVHVSRASTLGVADNQVLHAAIDASLVRLCVGLAGEWAESGVRVNVVAAGYLASDTDKIDPHEVRIPIRRLAHPEEVAALVVHLATGVDFVTGAVIAIDGGLSAKS